MGRDQGGAEDVGVGVNGVLPEIDGDEQDQAREERISRALAQLADGEVDRRHAPGACRRRQEIGAKGNRPHRERRLPQFGQQGVEGVTRRMRDAQDRRDELVLGGVAEERARRSGRGI